MVGEQLGEPRRGYLFPLAEHHGHGVGEDLAHEARGEVPAVLGPDHLHPVALDQLAEDGLYLLALFGEPPRPHQPPLLLGLALPLEADQEHGSPVVLFELLGHLRGAVVPVGQHPPFCHPRKEPLGLAQVVHVGPAEAGPHYDPRPGDHRMSPKPHELAQVGVAPPARYVPHHLAAVGAALFANRYREGVDRHQRGLFFLLWSSSSCRHEEELVLQHVLPELLLHYPKVCGLAGEGGEGGAVDFLYLGEVVRVVAPEVVVDALFGVYCEELPHNLHGYDLRVRYLGGRTALPYGPPILEEVIHHVENGHDEGAKIHKKRPPLRRSVWAPSSVPEVSVVLNLSEKLAHRVEMLTH